MAKVMCYDSFSSRFFETDLNELYAKFHEWKGIIPVDKYYEFIGLNVPDNIVSMLSRTDLNDNEVFGWNAMDLCMDTMIYDGKYIWCISFRDMGKWNGHNVLPCIFNRD